MTILVHHVGSLGDTIVTIPALRAVAAEWPQARLVLLHDSGSPDRPEAVPSSAVLGATSLIDAFVPYARHVRGFSLARELVRVLRTVRRLAPWAAVFVGPSERASSAVSRDLALYRLAGVRRFYGFTATAAAGTGVQGVEGRAHEAARKLERLAADGVTSAGDPRWLDPPLVGVDAGEAAAVGRWLDEVGAPVDRLVALGAETLMPAKLWPKARFVELGRRLLTGGWCPVVVGSGRGEGAARGWEAEWGGGLDAAGQWSVAGSAALLARCRAFVGIDSGVAHLAAAVGRPCVVVTSGRADLGQWDPLGAGHRVLRQRTPCEGCRAYACPVAGHPCMTQLSVDEVWAAVAEVLSAAAPAAH